ncbi:MAG TPA: hypothetical protein VF796_27665 [Humisphaera sp.]
MPDHEAITQGIVGLLRAGGGDGSPPDELADLASGYAALCKEANVRLRRCAEYLRAGAYDEAVHLAECQPPLDRLVPVLQFEQASEWAALCARSNLPLPPALLADCLPDLRKAADAVRRLGPLVARHRLLAVAQAPVKERLRVARLLAEQDPQNTIWAAEIRRLEAARLGELSAFIAKGTGGPPAADAKRSAALAAVAAELTATAWLTTAPSELDDAVRPYRERLAAQAARDEMVRLGQRLDPAAAGTLSVNEFEAAAGRWEALAAAYPSVVDAKAASAVRRSIAERRAGREEAQRAEQAKIYKEMFRPSTEPAAGDAVPAAGAPRVKGGQVAIALGAFLLVAFAIGWAFVELGGFAWVRNMLRK